MRGGKDSIMRIPTDRIRPFAGQPREYFDPAGLRDLERSIKAVGQQVEVIVRPIAGDPEYDYELVDGQRRWLACAKLGLAVNACVRETMGDQEDQFLTSVIANMSRADHTPVEIARAIARLRKRPEIASLPAAQQTVRIADIFGRSTPWVFQFESLLKLDPQVLALTGPPTPDGQRISIQSAVMLTSLAVGFQREMARAAQRMSARALNRLIRGKAKASGIKLRANSPGRQRQRTETSLNAIAEEAEALLELAGDFKSVFATRPRDEQESFVYRLDKRRRGAAQGSGRRSAPGRHPRAETRSMKNRELQCEEFFVKLSGEVDVSLGHLAGHSPGLGENLVPNQRPDFHRLRFADFTGETDSINRTGLVIRILRRESYFVVPIVAARPERYSKQSICGIVHNDKLPTFLPSKLPAFRELAL